TSATSAFWAWTKKAKNSSRFPWAATPVKNRPWVKSLAHLLPATRSRTSSPKFWISTSSSVRTANRSWKPTAVLATTRLRRRSMAQLIKKGQLVTSDEWQRLDDEAVMADYSLISLQRWQDNAESLAPLAQAGKIGLWLNSEDTADRLGDDCRQCSIIAIEFPKFSDGRGYSTARLLRERHGYRGELRSVGDVLIDQLFFMQ